jgi:amino acid permease
MVKALYFFAIMLTAIGLGAGLTHLFELPNKISLDAADYFTVQRNYDNWWIVGLVVPLAFLSVLALTVALRGTGEPFTLALIALVLLVGELVVFWGLTAPVNRETLNWTRLPGNWQRLRAQWEYSHAVRAFLYVLALGALVMSVLDWRAAG